ncbi:hypothetical protein GWO13_04850 [Candidatus Bathyarchaeota archaeon]|nr:hypothetical protein [Candidatus Bathyarchaeota archaeon]
MKCEYCEKDVVLPFRCPFCNQYYCTEHRLPENHECPEYWRARAPRERPPPIIVEEEPEATPYEYTITYTPPPISRPFRFSPKELRHLTVGALLVIGVGLSYIPQAVSALGLSALMRPETLLSLALIFTFSFLLHEIAHKLSAQHFGLWAEFRLTLFGALLTLLSIISPIKFISPGVVMIAGPMGREIAGKTGLAGPLTNIAFSIIFVAFTLYPLNPFFWIIIVLGATFNAWIALLNLIPFGVLDGAKVFGWNKVVWGVLFIISMALSIFTFIHLSG